jgi:hypothetical protein
MRGSRRRCSFLFSRIEKAFMIKIAEHKGEPLPLFLFLKNLTGCCAVSYLQKT